MHAPSCLSTVNLLKRTLGVRGVRTTFTTSETGPKANASFAHDRAVFWEGCRKLEPRCHYYIVVVLTPTNNSSKCRSYQLGCPQIVGVLDRAVGLMISLSAGGVSLQQRCPTDLSDGGVGPRSSPRSTNSTCLVSRALGSMKPLEMTWCAFLHERNREDKLQTRTICL